MPSPQTHDEQVARLALDHLYGEGRQIAQQRGLPADVRAATPDEELDLFDQWDPSVDPQAVLSERFAFHAQNGMPPDAAMAEAVLEAAAAGYSKRLKMAQGGGRLSLSEQVRYLESMAQKSRARREARQQQQAGGLEGGDGELPG